MGLLIPTLKWTGLNSSLMISLCVSLPPHTPFSPTCTHILQILSAIERTGHLNMSESRSSRHPELEKNRSLSLNVKPKRKLSVFPKAAGCTTSTCVGLSVKLSLRKRQKPPWKFGGAAQAGAGGNGGDGWGWRRRKGGAFFEGREQGAEWSRRGRNSAVGCISVSRSDGWVVALFVLCCHTAPRTSLGINERGPDRRAGTRRASDAGDLSSSRLARARRHMKTEGRGEAAGLTGASLRVGIGMGVCPTFRDNTLTVWRGQSSLPVSSKLGLKYSTQESSGCGLLPSFLHRDKDEGHYQRQQGRSKIAIIN